MVASTKALTGVTSMMFNVIHGMAGVVLSVVRWGLLKRFHIETKSILSLGLK